MLYITEKKAGVLILIVSLLLFSYPLFPYAVTSIVFILFVAVVGALRYQTIKVEINKKSKVRVFFVLVSWVFLLSLTSLYSENIDNALNLTLRYLNILLILFVFIFAAGPSLYLKRHYLFLAFVFSNLCFSLFYYYKAITIIELTCYPEIYYQSWIDKIKFTISKPNHIIFSCLDQEYKHSYFIHRVYNSMNYLFSLLIIIEFLFLRRFKLLMKLLFALIAIYFCLLIYYQFSVVNVFLTLLLLPIFLTLKLINRGVKIKYIASCILIIVVSIVGIMSYSKYNVALDQIKPAIGMVKKVIGSTDGSSNVDIRYEINKANNYLFLKSPIFGYGVGDAKDKLVDYFKEHSNDSASYKEAYEKKLNSHNYYYFLLHAAGFFGLILFMMSFLGAIKISIKGRNLLYLFFIIIISVNLLFENMLSRIHGIFFYSVFNGLFLSDYLNQKTY
jgi:hypothetical protein